MYNVYEIMATIFLEKYWGTVVSLVCLVMSYGFVALEAYLILKHFGWA